MLDPAIQKQLREVFAPLQETILLSVRPSEHEKQQELRDLLQGLAETSEKIEVRVEGAESDIPSFTVIRGGHSTGITFDCIPGGHEFTSLVLAVLNAGGQGRMPDQALQRRVAALQGPIELRSFISLSCTNCPDIVQALDQMALMHGNLRHTIVDGALVPEEVERLGIRGVPAVFVGDEMLHSGRSDFGSLLEKLEERFGGAADAPAAGASAGAADTASDRQAASGDAGTAAEPRQYDVLVLGGGPAGAAAAIYSARKGLKTAVVAKRIGGQVNDTMGIQNLISVPSTEGPKLAADLRRHMEDYPIELLENRSVLEVVPAESSASGLHTIRAKGGEQFAAPALVVATGAKWRELGVPGEAEYIGRGVAFCPHCDGPFFAGKHVAVIGGGNSGVEAAIDLAGTCARVTLFEFADQLNADTVLQDALHKLPNVRVITSARTTEIVGNGSAVTAIRWEDRQAGDAADNGGDTATADNNRELELDGVFVQIGLLPNSEPVAEILHTNRFGEIEVDTHCRTSVPGIYAAGDVTTTPYKQIVVAMGEGSKAALAAFEDRVRGTGVVLPSAAV
ncbi:alkyl hydroperoxide reductase subunit F [Spirochaeta africana]|uniref:Alkyl hydroperoxide reductase, F subunit n=1 Tax=Spirochaeta africana (strain ATCC 700263 / DSM 8902 / Z-7692) TaxID=889378 RepID=H9UMH5_SPIAZ|nr:alkyl hydroperoxide reductase subunit F [Spirochaeta africana]AFG38718.1 alkyl hydroperoxide reductase, F subunit [Spirochaeta africana DSM 8902]